MTSITLPPGLTLASPSPTRGRSVVVTRSFHPGDLIAEFTDSIPSVAVPDAPHLPQTCSYCLAVVTPDSDQDLQPPSKQVSVGVRVRACTGCRTSHYCSAACQKSDWGLAHGKGECKAFKRARVQALSEAQSQSRSQSKSNLESSDSPDAIRTLPTPTRTLIQILVRPAMLAAVDQLEGHADALHEGDPETWADVEMQAQAALHFLGRDVKDGLAEAVGVSCKLRVNSFNRMDADLEQSGIYINPALAMVNHSCIPNAFVKFVGRKAVLRAYRDIKKGEEVEISYIDSTLHRSQRQKALQAQYHFECICPRCRDDLDVYQACQMYPHLELNSFSLVPDLDKLRHPPIKQFLHSNKSLQQNVDQIYSTCTEPVRGSSWEEKSKELGRRWKMCSKLREAKLYAIEPLTHVLVEADVYFGVRGEFASGLAIACFLALNSDPYKGPMPFIEPRVKRMFLIAKLLANTASATESALGGGCTTTEERIYRALSQIDQATMCQIILRIIIHYCPAAHSKDWQVYHQAKDLLDDLESLPGRDTENAVIDAFVRNHKGLEERRFFEISVLEPIQTIAGFALEVMDTEFGT
ncbi:hypothetical protein GGR54DRAFT_640606 [Hypoxylon sp. NC1633]|nr:hypothetical protein GGR54DRAFT_640606 [Hypoxylon sp. NC1633]